MQPPEKPEDRAVPVPCVWMAAGVISYKLCDLGHDCESCPLDAALTRSPTLRHGAGAPAPSTAWVFPAGRRYSLAHLWVRELGDRLRVGVDALAAVLLSSIEGVVKQAAGPRLRQGQTACSVKLLGGEIAIQTPVSGRPALYNEALAARPDLLVTSPYDDGWLFELAPPFDRDELANLLPAEERGRLARLDIQRFQRRVAMHLLQGADRVGEACADGGELLHDVRQMLGAARFLDLVREALTAGPTPE
ncbi:MAG: hypothetical protein ABI333_06280 [bacterium]